tara:strand:+ start:195 stop:689 length:495 start_codon:yes stop_codon:yes gene_type:complete
MTNLLCIDPGRHSAWLVGTYEDIDLPEIYTLQCNHKSHAEVYYAFFEHGLRMAKNIEHIVYEEPYVRSHKAARMQYGMIGIINLIAAHTPTCKAVWAIHPSWIKKQATGKGNATKDEMIATAQSYFEGLPNLQEQVSSSHSADAFWIYRYFIENKTLRDFENEE